MKINGAEMVQMINETYKTGSEMVGALNLLYDLAQEREVCEDPRYKEASRILVKCMIEFQETGVARGMDICRKNSIINAFKENLLGRKIFNKIMQKLEP